jgi:cyclic-di-GMP-binding protein
MADSNTFDIVSQVDFQEVKNALSQAEKELITRYDLKKANVVLKQEGEEFVLESADEFTLNQALELVKSKLVRRSVNLKSLRPGKLEAASGGRARQKFTFQNGIPQETAKKIVADIKAAKMKVQGSIQGDSVRVSGKKRDDLQEAIALLKAKEYDVHITFTNYRSS